MIHKILLFNPTNEAYIPTLKQKALELLTAAGAKNVTFRPALPHGTVVYQYLITVEFDSMEAHDQYMAHEQHVRFSKEVFRPNIDSSTLVIQMFDNANAQG